jgi:hypothetical protein
MGIIYLSLICHQIRLPILHESSPCKLSKWKPFVFYLIYSFRNLHNSGIAGLSTGVFYGLTRLSELYVYHREDLKFIFYRRLTFSKIRFIESQAFFNCQSLTTLYVHSSMYCDVDILIEIWLLQWYRIFRMNHLLARTLPTCISYSYSQLYTYVCTLEWSFLFLLKVLKTILSSRFHRLLFHCKKNFPKPSNFLIMVYFKDE